MYSILSKYYFAKKICFVSQNTFFVILEETPVIIDFAKEAEFMSEVIEEYGGTIALALISIAIILGTIAALYYLSGVA